MDYKDVLQEARDDMDLSDEGSADNRDNYYDDIKFARLAEQWPEAIKRQRDQEGRPALVINKLPALIRSVVNESRQNEPSIEINPVDNGSDVDTADVIGGLVRSIERNSNASVAYDTAIDNAVTGGFGFFRIDIDYAHDETFELEASIKRIPDSLSVHWDTTTEAYDASDWNFAFVSNWLTRDAFEREYPDADPISFDGFGDFDGYARWMDTEGQRIRVAEYFKKVPKTRKLLRVATPDAAGNMVVQNLREDEFSHLARTFMDQLGMDHSGDKDAAVIAHYMDVTNSEVRAERTVNYNDLMRYMLNGAEVISEDKWPGQNIPICPVWGDEVWSDGYRYFLSMIRDARDPQIMFNFWRSATTELVALAPKTPWLGPKGFIPKGQESKWESANTRSHAYLEYEPDIGPPQRQMFAGVPPGALQEAMNAADDMKAITGIYDASLGARSNETSGKAILARERQGDVSNFHFIDNLNRAIQYAGKVLVEIIPAIYGPRESIRILGPDSKAKVVKLTQEAGGSVKPGINGEDRLYNISIGKYDVTVSSGPNFATQREETRETLIEIMRAVPQAANFIGDMLLSHMDFQGADKVARRLKALLPPEIRQMEEAEENADNPQAAALQQQLVAKDQELKQVQQAVMAEIEKIKQENAALKQDRAIEVQKLQLESQYKAQELSLKDRELALKEQDTDFDNTAEVLMNREKMAFEANEKEKDREFQREKMKLEMVREIMRQDGRSQSDAEQKVSEYIFKYDQAGNIIGAAKMTMEKGGTEEPEEMEAGE